MPQEETEGDSTADPASPGLACAAWKLLEEAGWRGHRRNHGSTRCLCSAQDGPACSGTSAATHTRSGRTAVSSPFHI